MSTIIKNCEFNTNIKYKKAIKSIAEALKEQAKANASNSMALSTLAESLLGSKISAVSVDALCNSVEKKNETIIHAQQRN